MQDNIFKSAESKICLSLIEKYFSAPKAKYDKRRNEYFTLSPLRADEHVKAGTFSINVNTGLWSDLATSDKGNFIQLVQKKFNLSALDAAKKIIQDSGGIVMDDKRDERHTAQTDKKPAAIIPIPAGVAGDLNKIVQNQYNQDAHGKAVDIFVYKNIDQESVMCTCRYEKEIDGKITKEVIPYYYSKKGWRAGRPDLKKYTLYNEHKLTDRKTHRIIVEGERKAKINIDGYLLVSWLGGTGSVELADWDKLKDNTDESTRITIWPDADDSGLKAALQIKKLFPQAEILDIQGKPKAWDICDAQSEGIDIEKFVAECPRLFPEEFPTTPYLTFIRAIKELYGEDNLQQYDGLYYIYNDQKHYWSEHMIVNIESDIQKWIENNQISYLDELDIAIHTFMKNTSSLLKHYSTGYYKGNPFKDSALQPYIHVRNGAIEINDSGFIFHDRKNTEEDFFKKLYSTHALDFDFNMSYYKDMNLKDLAPTFYYYIESLMPQPEYKTPEAIKEYEKELYLTLEFFSMLIAYVLNPVKRKPYFMALYGSQDSGKSFFVNDLLQMLIGEQFFVARSVEEMTKSRFAAYDLWGAKVYLDDDVRSNITLPDAFIKFYSGLKSITVEPKFGAAIKGVKISVSMFFISNHAFTVVGGSEGLERRLIYIPYKKRLKKPDVFLLDKIIGKKAKGAESGTHAGEQFDERPAIIGFALRGIESLIRNNHNFVMPNWIAEERKDWLIRSNTITQFLYEKIFPGTETSYPSKELYDNYKDWCKDEETRKPYGKNKFYEMLKLEPRVEHKHMASGDRFKFELDNKVDDGLESIPF